MFFSRSENRNFDDFRVIGLANAILMIFGKISVSIICLDDLHVYMVPKTIKMYQQLAWKCAKVT